MASIRRLYLSVPIAQDEDAPYEAPIVTVPTAKLIEFLPAESLVTVAAILGSRFSEIVQEIEAIRAA